jgi:hypothetical protein
MSESTIGTMGPIFVPYPADQTPAVADVGREEGYFLLRVHSAQAAYWGSTWGSFINPAYQILVTSQVMLHPRTDQPVRGIQVARRIRRKQAVQLGLRSNLTDLVPTTLERVSVTLDFVLDRKDRLKALTGAINDSGFLGTLSMAEPTLATAKALGKAGGLILDAFLQPEERTPILQFTGDFNVGSRDLKAGYHVLLGSVDESNPLPRQIPKLEIRGRDLILDDQPVTKLSYVVLEVICTRARQRSGVADWDVRLRQAEDKASDFEQERNPTEESRKKTWNECSKLIQEARTLLRADPSVLPREANDIILAVYASCEKVFSGTSAGTRSPKAAVLAAITPTEITEARRMLQVPEAGNLEEDVRRYAEDVLAAKKLLATVAQKSKEADTTHDQVNAQERDLPEDNTPDD